MTDISEHNAEEKGESNDCKDSWVDLTEPGMSICVD